MTKATGVAREIEFGNNCHATGVGVGNKIEKFFTSVDLIVLKIVCDWLEGKGEELVVCEMKLEVTDLIKPTETNAVFDHADGMRSARDIDHEAAIVGGWLVDEIGNNDKVVGFCRGDGL